MKVVKVQVICKCLEILSREESTQISEVKYMDDKVWQYSSGKLKQFQRKLSIHILPEVNMSKWEQSLPLLSFNNALLWNGSW